MKALVARYEVRFRTHGKDGEFIPSLVWRCRDLAESSARARLAGDPTISGFRVVRVFHKQELPE